MSVINFYSCYYYYYYQYDYSLVLIIIVVAIVSVITVAFGWKPVGHNAGECHPCAFYWKVGGQVWKLRVSPRPRSS